MNNPRVYCPRCNEKYPVTGDWCHCDRCNFHYYDGPGCVYQWSIIDNGLRYVVSHYYQGYVNIDSYYMDGSGDKTFKLECELPLDITLDTLKLYLTFS